MLISFGALNSRRTGVTASENTTNSMVQYPAAWIASFTGRAGLSSPFHARQASHSAGMQPPTKAMIFSGDQRPDLSRRKGIDPPQPRATIAKRAVNAMQF